MQVGYNTLKQLRYYKTFSSQKGIGSKAWGLIRVKFFLLNYKSLVFFYFQNLYLFINCLSWYERQIIQEMG